MVGAPIAVRIALDQQASSRAEETRADCERRDSLLGLIGDDLLETLEELEKRIHHRDVSVAPFLGSGLYPTLQASGQLGLIRDAALLRVISRAYDRISVTAYLERLAWETDLNPQARRRTVPPSELRQEVRGYVADQDEHTRAAIHVALEALGRPLR